MIKAYQKLVILIFLTIFSGLFLFFNFVFAEQKLEKICKPLSIEGIDDVCGEMSQEECRSLLKRCLQFHQDRSDHYEGRVTQTQREKKTFQNQIYVLSRRVRQMNNEIHSNNLMIKGLNFQISDTRSSITMSSQKMEELKEKLAELLRQIYKQDRRSVLEVILTEDRLSDFFDELVALESLNLSNQELLNRIKALKENLENKQMLLGGEKEDLEQLVVVRTLQRQENRRLKGEQEWLLRETKGEEALYQKHLRETREDAAKIRTRILELVGVPVGEQLPFGQLLDIAKWAQVQTEIRPAFLLSIITQESALGRNVGQCYLPRNPAENKRRRVMAVPPLSRRDDVSHFRNITRDLGKDPYKTPISCPMAFGFGGAMGPAQFIPTTWMSIRDEVEAIVNVPPNPWSIQHSFLASALYLRRLGGTKNELRSAMRYFSGNRWTAWEERFYGRPVIERANCLQVFIDHGTMTRRCDGLIFIPK